MTNIFVICLCKKQTNKNPKLKFIGLKQQTSISSSFLRFRNPRANELVDLGLGSLTGFNHVGLHCIVEP